MKQKQRLILMHYLERQEDVEKRIDIALIEEGFCEGQVIDFRDRCAQDVIKERDLTPAKQQ